ncbi:MAG TPA: hypothetical protein VFB40_05095 [Actinocrinis sp.]|nr:hypothetical protein [Actinocrinis sp.]
MTSVGVPQTVKSLTWRWIAYGLGAVGSAMAIGRIPLEFTMHALHLEPEGGAAGRTAHHSAKQD